MANLNFDVFVVDFVYVAKDVFDDVSVRFVEGAEGRLTKIQTFTVDPWEIAWEQFKTVVSDVLSYYDVDEIIDFINEVIWDVDVDVELDTIRTLHSSTGDGQDRFQSEKLAMIMIGYIYRNRSDEVSDYLGDYYADSWVNLVEYFFGISADDELF